MPKNSTIVKQPLSADIKSRALGAYLGLAVGDALGAPIEFLTKREIAHRGGHQEMTGGGWLKLKPGQITDDTEMSLYLGRAWIETGGWNAQLAANQLAEWLKHYPIDVGNTCRRGIRRFMLDGTLHGLENEADGGNGAAMRILPIALATYGDDAAFECAAIEQAHLTHYHPLSDAATLTLGRMVHLLLAGQGVNACLTLANKLIVEHPQFRYAPYAGRASGYIVDTMQTVMHHFFNSANFEDCVVATVNCGEDADTTGAIVGMLAGALYGVSAIPQRWLNKLDDSVRSEIEFQVSALMKGVLK
ncbi:MAG: ADP-ribosyl-[dinitrogen reductase] hydrolase [Methylotenera sp.]|uniref:ADP-ribosyl-[dinitrogen reductase] hydrolase n=1 Tax=Methylotenera sp. TaxID=2051956 RepID=UPI00248883BE|nr:ADP-ribosyl-[dinitrogen reductase] hydrolase [Methylotenera sp.]MDI1310398.1 ADP-ribosyl-[dinitrogen reductase] hydrolase [Methylotenera sp.]